MLQRSGWTRDIDMFFQWLSAIPFSGGGFDDVAVAEGLTEALMMFSSLNGSQTQQNADGQRHCILVAASNPYPLPRPLYCPAIQNLEQSGNVEAHTSYQLADAETVAKAFPQCSVSLSVICPRKLPKLRAIYNAGKRDPQAADPAVDTSNNPNFLVLISENFSVACAAFSHTEMESLAPNQSLAEMDMSAVPPVSGAAATSNPSVMNQQPISAGNIAAATEPTMVTSVSEPAPPLIPTAHPTSQVAASLLSGSPTSVSEEMVPSNKNTKETTPIVSVMTQSLGPFRRAAANVGILNGVASAIPAAVLTSGQLDVTSMTAFAPFAGTGQIDQNSVPASLKEMVMNNENTKETTPIVSVMTQSLGPFSRAAANVGILSGVASAIPSAPAVLTSGKLGVTSVTGFAPCSRTGQIDQNSVPASLTLMAPSMYGDSNLCMYQPFSNIQGGIGAGSRTTPVMSQGNRPGCQMMQSGIGMHQNVLSGIGTGTPSGIGPMMPTPRLTQQGQPGILPLGRINSAEANMSPSQQQTLATSPSAQSGFVKIWEGKLSTQRLGEPAVNTRLQGYKRPSASESLAANWPPTMEILRFISKEQMNEHVRQYTGKADILLFWAIDQHSVLNNLQESNNWAVISLPSQTLLLYVSDKAYRLVGLLLPCENMEFMPKIPNQQLQAQPLPQVQQLQAQPLPRVQQLQAQSLPRVQKLQAQLLHQVQKQQPHRLQLKEPLPLPLLQQQPLSLLQKQQQPFQQQPPRPLKRQHDVPLQEQSKVPIIHQQDTPQTEQQIPKTQQIEQLQSIIETAVDDHQDFQEFWKSLSDFLG